MDLLERGEVKIAANPKEQGKYEDTMTLEEQWEYHNKLGDFYRKHPKIEREDRRRENEICGYDETPRIWTDEEVAELRRKQKKEQGK